MSLEILYGPAGSGKSTYLQDKLLREASDNPTVSYLLIVPDQFTMQTQSDVVKRAPNGGILNLDVLSFSRLSYRVFSEAGRADIPVLDDTGKSLVLRRVAAQVMDDMPYIGRNLFKPGYLHEAKSSISEFMQYGLSVGDVKHISAGLEDGLLKHKLSDLSVLYDAFMKFTRDRFVTSEENLSVLCKRIPEAGFIKDSVIVFDGFTGFTPIQENVIMTLLKYAAKVTVSVTLSAPECIDQTGNDEKLFYLSRRTANRLKAKAAEIGVSVLKDVAIADNGRGRFAESDELKHLEANLFRYPFGQYTGALSDISAFAAPNIEAEVSEIALRIHELVRTQGYEYRDIAVVTGNMDAYADAFEARLQDLDIPYFIDRTAGVVLNPFTEYIKSAMLIIAKDYSYDSVMHFLKSGFADFTDSEIDRFDKYVLSHNLKGAKAYHKPFTRCQKGMSRDFALRDLPGHESVRSRLTESLSILERNAGTAGDYARNLYDFIKAADSFNKLDRMAVKAEASGDVVRAGEYRQIYKCIMNLLETIILLVGDEPMKFSEFYDIFDAGISEIKLGNIPKSVDRILVGDIERTRLKEIKAVFFAGVNDGNIPKSGANAGLLSNIDRERLAGEGYELAPTPREEMYTQKLYLYMNMCKPSRKLCISYSGMGRDGKGLRPSYLLDVCKRIFPTLNVVKIDNAITAEKFVTVKDSFRFFARLLRDFALGNTDEYEASIATSLLAIYRESEGQNIADDILDRAFYEYEPIPLSRTITDLLYKDVIKASVSRMESYAQCPYAYYLKYGMGLREDTEADFRAMDLGNVYHAVLDAFFKELELRGLKWEDMSLEEADALVEAVVKRECADYEQGMLMDNEQTLYTVTKITRIMKRTVETIRYQLSKGSFVNDSHEYPFERRVLLDNGREMLIKGKIDRIDLCMQGDRILVKIVDYKSSTHDIDVTQIYYGIQEQLAVYLKEAMTRVKETHPEKEVVPSAILYYDIDNPYINVGRDTSDDVITDEIHKALKLKGIVEASADNVRAHDADNSGSIIPAKLGKDDEVTGGRDGSHIATETELNNMMQYVDNMVKSIGTDIYDGKIAISPMNSEKVHSCKYCNYKSVCRFDDRIHGYTERDGKDVSAEQARELVMGGTADGPYVF